MEKGSDTKTTKIRLALKNFRAIKEADIILDGITVVAGENGSGKSTISKFLYYVFKISNEYENEVKFKLLSQMSPIYNFIAENSRDLDKQSSYVNISKLLSNYAHLFINDSIDRDYWNNTISKFSDLITNTFNPTESNPQYIRIKNILIDILDQENLEGKTFIQLIELLKLKIENYFSDADRLTTERPSGLLVQSLSKEFSNSRLPEEYSIFEYSALIIDNNQPSIVKSHTIQKTAYIDTPMLFGIDNSKYEYWTNVNNILTNPIIQNYNKYINDFLNKNILLGKTFINSDKNISEKFIYKREDGSEFNLLDCATGVKSFAMLQMMLKNGFLNKYTLLIIDEPEAHLHPQWIVEYARLIVLLNKHIGVKFFIASHNPDMVSAIKYISEKEQTDDDLNFYLAEQNMPEYTYSYKHLGTDIEPIFESFNIALDRINQYGG